jgi:Leucine-rich repeat (LRR) protein
MLAIIFESKTLASLKRLVVLKVNYAVIGNLPSEIGLLTNLKVLDLSSNYLCGDLPKEMSGLRQLAYLNLGNQKPANPLFGHASFGVVPKEFVSYVDF